MPAPRHAHCTRYKFIFPPARAPIARASMRKPPAQTAQSATVSTGTVTTALYLFAEGLADVGGF
jgi:hypothetical protein